LRFDAAQHGIVATLDSESIEKSLARQATESITDQSDDLAQPRGLPRLASRYSWQTFRKNLLIALLVPASKASRLQMNFNLPSLPWQIAHAPDVAAVVRNSAFQTGRTARQVLGARPKDNAVRRFLYRFQD
jgi:hypothetical protein